MEPIEPIMRIDMDDIQKTNQLSSRLLLLWGKPLGQLQGSIQKQGSQDGLFKGIGITSLKFQTCVESIGHQSVLGCGSILLYWKMWDHQFWSPHFPCAKSPGREERSATAQSAPPRKSLKLQRFAGNQTEWLKETLDGQNMSKICKKIDACLVQVALMGFNGTLHLFHSIYQWRQKVRLLVLLWRWCSLWCSPGLFAVATGLFAVLETSFLPQSTRTWIFCWGWHLKAPNITTIRIYTFTIVKIITSPVGPTGPVELSFRTVQCQASVVVGITVSWYHQGFAPQLNL